MKTSFIKILTIVQICENLESYFIIQVNQVLPNRMINKQLEEFMGMRESLLEERKNLEEQIKQIDEALGVPAGLGLRGMGIRRRAKRARNEMSLKQAISQVIEKKPMGRREILKAVQDLGYKFSTSHPLNSLSAALYSNKAFAKNGNVFGLADSKSASAKKKTAGRKKK